MTYMHLLVHIVELNRLINFNYFIIINYPYTDTLYTHNILCYSVILINLYILYVYNYILMQ